LKPPEVDQQANGQADREERKDQRLTAEHAKCGASILNIADLENITEHRNTASLLAWPERGPHPRLRQLIDA
jgi:hypothetical protein